MMRTEWPPWCSIARVAGPLPRPVSSPPYGSKIPLRMTQAWAVANCTTALRTAVTLAWIFSSAGVMLAFGVSGYDAGETVLELEQAHLGS